MIGAVHLPSAGGVTAAGGVASAGGLVAAGAAAGVTSATHTIRAPKSWPALPRGSSVTRVAGSALGASRGGSDGLDGRFRHWPGRWSNSGEGWVAGFASRGGSAFSPRGWRAQRIDDANLVVGVRDARRFLDPHQGRLLLVFAHRQADNVAWAGKRRIQSLLAQLDQDVADLGDPARPCRGSATDG